METVKTLLRMPELIRALKPFMSIPISPVDVFRLIGEGQVKPCGYIQRIPVFDIAQISDIAKELQDQQDNSTSKETSSERQPRPNSMVVANQELDNLKVGSG